MRNLKKRIQRVFSARLAQKMAFWVMCSIFVIELIIVIPSYIVREQVLLDSFLLPSCFDIFRHSLLSFLPLLVKRKHNISQQRKIPLLQALQEYRGTPKGLIIVLHNTHCKSHLTSNVPIPVISFVQLFRNTSPSS